MYAATVSGGFEKGKPLVEVAVILIIQLPWVWNIL